VLPIQGKGNKTSLTITTENCENIGGNYLSSSGTEYSVLGCNSVVHYPGLFSQFLKSGLYLLY